MGFGFNQLKKTTPQYIKSVRDALIYFLAGCLAFTPLLSPRLHLTAGDFAQVIGFVILIIKFVAKFFGVSDDEAVSNAVKSIDEVKTGEK